MIMLGGVSTTASLEEALEIVSMSVRQKTHSNFYILYY